MVTVPCGRATIHRPSHQVYDRARLDELTRGFKVDVEEYYLQREGEDWERVTLDCTES